MLISNDPKPIILLNLNVCSSVRACVRACVHVYISVLLSMFVLKHVHIWVRISPPPYQVSLSGLLRIFFMTMCDCLFGFVRTLTFAYVYTCGCACINPVSIRT